MNELYKKTRLKLKKDGKKKTNYICLKNTILCAHYNFLNKIQYKHYYFYSVLTIETCDKGAAKTPYKTATTQIID